MALVSKDDLRSILRRSVPRLKPQLAPEKEPVQLRKEARLRELARQHLEKLGK